MMIRTVPGDGITIDDAVLFAIRASVRVRKPVFVTLRGRQFGVSDHMPADRADVVGVYSVRPHKAGRAKAARRIEADLVRRIAA